jgi:hypothetical protein
MHDVIEGEDDNAEDIAEVASDDPKDMEFFQDFINCLDNDDLIYGSPRRLDNFKEMNQAAKNPKQWMMLSSDL